MEGLKKESTAANDFLMIFLGINLLTPSLRNSLLKEETNYIKTCNSTCCITAQIISLLSQRFLEGWGDTQHIHSLLIPSVLHIVDAWRVFVYDMSSPFFLLCRWNWNPLQCPAENKVKPWTEPGLSTENLLMEIQLHLPFHLKNSEEQALILNHSL